MSLWKSHGNREMWWWWWLAFISRYMEVGHRRTSVEQTVCWRLRNKWKSGTLTQTKRAFIKCETTRPMIHLVGLEIAAAQSADRRFVSCAVYNFGLYGRMAKRKQLLKKTNEESHFQFAITQVSDTADVDECAPIKWGQNQTFLDFIQKPVF